MNTQNILDRLRRQLESTIEILSPVSQPGWSFKDHEGDLRCLRDDLCAELHRMGRYYFGEDHERIYETLVDVVALVNVALGLKQAGRVKLVEALLHARGVVGHAAPAP